MTRTAKCVLIGAGMGSLGVLVYLLPWVAVLEEEVGLRLLYKARGVLAPPSQVLVVAIDRRAAKHFGLPLEPVKWPRDMHARLIDTLSRAGAAVIAFDVLFHEQRTPEEDARLAGAVRAAGNVVLAQGLTRETLTVDGARETGDALITIEQVIDPIAPLARAAAGLAPFPLPRVPIRLNRYWLFKPEAGDIPTLPVVAFQAFAGPAHDDLAALIASEAPDILRPPSHPDMAVRAVTLRACFVQHPGLADRLLRRLDRAPANRAMPGQRKKLVRALIRLYGYDNHRYLNFYGPAGTIQTLSYHQVVPSPDSPAAEALPDLRGKVVFVGQTESVWPKAKDGFYSVYTGGDGVDISGVEVAATAFANLFEQRGVVSPSRITQLALVFAWSAVLVVAAFIPGPVWAAAGLTLLGGAYGWLACRQFAAAGVWCPLVTPLLIMPALIYVCSLLHRYGQANRERRNIRTAFGYYLPNRVVDLLSSNIKQLQRVDQAVYGICLMTDAAHYTTLSETMSPEALQKLMNRYYEAVFGPVKAHGGIIVQVVGDAVLSLWTSGRSDPARKADACRAALDIVAAVERFNAASPQNALPTRIGLNSGPIVLGNIGAMNHFEYRPVGDIINTAARLEGLNKYLGTRVLITREVAGDLPAVSKAVVRYMGRFLFVGKSRPVEVYELSRADAAVAEAVRRPFERGVAAFQQGRWESAIAEFARVLAVDAADGPSRFYLRLCGQHRLEPAKADWNGAVCLEKK